MTVVLALILMIWLVWVLVAHWVVSLSTRADIETGLALGAARLYARLFHGLRIEGSEHLPSKADAGPLVVVCNHTSGIDPILIQAICRFEVRWIMAKDMRLRWLEDFWQWGGIIFVDRKNPSTAPVRQALSHLRCGGVLGLFPEGHIARPRQTLQPFHSGVGAFVRQTGARVLPIVIDGTPGSSRSAWVSLFLPSRSRVRIYPPIEYEKRQSPAEIAEDLHGRFAEWTGWPTSHVLPAYADSAP